METERGLKDKQDPLGTASGDGQRRDETSAQQTKVAEIVQRSRAQGPHQGLAGTIRLLPQK